MAEIKRGYPKGRSHVILNFLPARLSGGVSGSFRIEYQIPKFQPAGRLEFGMTRCEIDLTFWKASWYN